MEMRIILNTMALALALTSLGCPRDPEPEAPAPAGFDEATVRSLQEVLGRLKLVREEYRDAVKDGEIIDATEYEEAEMFAEQAALHYRRAGDVPALRAPEAHATLRAGLGELMGLIAKKAPVPEVEAHLARLTSALDALDPGAIPPAVEGTRAAVAKADAAILAERVVVGYRVGLVVGPPRPLHVREAGSLSPRPVPPGAHWVGVALREPRTKRALPGAQITVTTGGEATPLVAVWDEFEQYGTNLVFPDTPVTLVVEIAPPAYHRHGDMLGVHTAPARTEFAVSWKDGRAVVTGERPAAVAEDYDVGDDVLQALAESRWKEEVGPYLVGFIAESPEPVWLWHEGGPELHAVQAGHTHHLEIVLLEKGTHRIVPSASVRLTLVPESGGDALTYPLHALLSAFYHYGATVTVPPGRYAVTAHIDPPALGAFAPDVFPAPVEARFSWDRGGAP